jgi:polyferredoxin
VLFAVGGLVLIWVGYAMAWRWVRKRWLRILHFCAIALVAVEALIGAACPLTVLEDVLRPGEAADGGFIQRWLHAVMYWDWPLWVFTALYLAFAAVVAVTYVLLPPAPARGGSRAQRLLG